MNEAGHEAVIDFNSVTGVIVLNNEDLPVSQADQDLARPSSVALTPPLPLPARVKAWASIAKLDDGGVAARDVADLATLRYGNRVRRGLYCVRPP